MKHHLHTHIKENHNISTVASFLKEIVYGGTDGVVTTFAVVAGFTGANFGGSVVQFSFLTVLLFGLANMFADGISMGLGNLLSLRSEKKHYEHERKKEMYEIINNPESEKHETVELLQVKGFSKNDAEQLSNIYSKNPEYWADFMMNHELEMPNPGNDNPIYNGLATFFSFLFFGFIPLIPYFFPQEVGNTFILACSFALGALILIGILRWKITRENIWKSMSEVIFLGGTAAVVAFIVGTFFQG